jgi:uncharacterized membrane protein
VEIQSFIESVVSSRSSILYAVVAAISGLAAAFAIIKPNLNETLLGVAVSVSIVPPLAVAGVGVSHLDWGMISSALILFLVNVAGIIFSGMVAFSLFHLTKIQKVVSETLKAEKKKIE